MGHKKREIVSEPRKLDLKKGDTAPKITKREIIKLISKETNLTKDQVNECFKAYIKIIENFVRADNLPERLKIELPELGYFQLIEKQGAKKGDVFNMPQIKTDENGETYTVTVKCEIEEDRPNYNELRFHVYGTPARSIRNISEARFLRIKKKASEEN